MKPFIGVKRLWYGEPIMAAVTKTSLAAWIKSAKEIKNSHKDTFQYTQDDPSVTDYINELTGRTYYRDKTDNGAKTIAFTIGEYDFQTKADLQGGTVEKENETEIGWSAPDSAELVYKAIVAQTKTGNFVVFTNAGIIGKTTTAEKNLGLGLTAVAMESQNEGVKDEYWFDGTQITLS